MSGLVAAEAERLIGPVLGWVCIVSVVTAEGSDGVVGFSFQVSSDDVLRSDLIRQSVRSEGVFSTSNDAVSSVTAVTEADVLLTAAVRPPFSIDLCTAHNVPADDHVVNISRIDASDVGLEDWSHRNPCLLIYAGIDLLVEAMA